MPAPDIGDASAALLSGFYKSWPRIPAWVMGLLLIPFLVFWVEYTEIVAEGPDLAAMSLPVAVFFALFLILPLNVLVGKLSPRHAYTQAELLLIYSMNVLAVYISGIGMMQFLTPNLVGWQHYATPENGWANWQHRLALWALPDPSVIPAYYAGGSTVFSFANLRGWGRAMGIWTAFLFTLIFCLYCVAALMRRQWVEHEHLVFPIAQIPLAITQNGGDTSLWRSRLLWLGVGVSVVLESFAAAHFTLMPTLPYLPLKDEDALTLNNYITSPPWNAIGFTPVNFYPWVIGLTYLLSLDVSFSCWFFYLLTKMENVAATAWGFRDPGAGPALARMPYVTEQCLGAFLGLALLSLWLARSHLRTVWQQAFSRAGTMQDAEEALSYRTAYLGVIASAALLIGFGVALGLSLWVSALFFGLYFLIALAFTRIRAEAGLGWEDGPPGLVHGTLVGYAGTQALMPQELTAFSQLYWCDSGWRCLPQPAMVEAMKMMSASHPRLTNHRHLTGALSAAAIVGALASWLACLGIYYHFGADTAHVNPWRSAQGHLPFDELQGWLQNSTSADVPRIAASGVGLVVVLVLGVLRTRLVWWPLNPVGYAVSGTDPMTWLWCPMLLGWLCKMLTVRYGGIKLYRKAWPFFVGLVLGDFAISGLLALYSLVTGTPSYRTFPN
jgi:hypothetical protein